MEFRQLKYFEAVAQTRSFTEAARRLFVSQGALSQQMKLLEDELGSPLFERGARGVRLTEAGEQFLPLARRTLTDMEASRQRVRDLSKSLGGELNIGVTFSFRDPSTEAIADFLKRYPDVHLNIFYKTSSELADMLRCGNLDFFLAFKSQRVHSDLDFEPLFEYDLSAVMRKDHPLANHNSLSMKDLDGFPVALPGSGMQARKAFDRYVSLDTEELDVKVEINDPNVILDIVANTGMLTILSGQVVNYRDGIVAVPLENMPKMKGGVYFLGDSYRKKSAGMFLQMLKDSDSIRNLMTLD
ncbi:MAG: LysR family transcriptional regulator [Bacteroidales bacterium]|nr:LysR family transcriptional regulator [Candidatus Cacconaster merdequi]